MAVAADGGVLPSCSIPRPRAQHRHPAAGSVHSLLLVACLGAVAVSSAAAAACSGNPAALPNAAWACNNTAPGATCVAACKQGYTSVPAPTALCKADGTWDRPFGGCFQVCAGLPAAPLPNGAWDPACDSVTRFNTRCRGICSSGTSGSPSIYCGAHGFESDSVIGRCVTGPVCSGTPTATLLNGRFPSSCADTPVGGVCEAQCNANYGGPVAATVTCQPGGVWAPTVTGSCSKVCAGLPPAISGGTWPASCADKTVVGTVCNAACSPYGAASITCGNNGWMTKTLRGRCSTTPVCVGVPPVTLVNGMFPQSCMSASIGTACTGICNVGYGGQVTPTVACLADPADASKGAWDSKGAGSCVRVCAGMPPASLIPGGQWSATCNGATPVNTRCLGSCSTFGSVSIRCAPGGVWDASTVRGQCSTKPVCEGMPPGVLNGQFPDTCVNSPADTVCTAKCNRGYLLAGSPTSVCTWDGVTGSPARWADPNPSLCMRGAAPVQNGKAFIVSESDNFIVICDAAKGKFTGCTSNDGSVGLAEGYTFSSPIGITLSGSNLWVSDRGSGTRVWLCTWSGQKLTACDFTDFADTPAPIGGWVGAGAMVLDKQRNVLYAALDQAGCILSCPDPTSLRKCECTSFPGVMEPLEMQTRYPTGLALAYDEVWVTSNAGISRCPLTATGYDNNTCITQQLQGVEQDAVGYYGLYVDTAGSGTVYMGDNDHNLVWVCNRALTACMSSNGNNTFSDPQQLIGGPGYAGLVVEGGYLYAPLTSTGPVPAIAVCGAPQSASSCVLSALEPPISFTGGQNIIVLPAGVTG